MRHFPAGKFLFAFIMAVVIAQVTISCGSNAANNQAANVNTNSNANSGAAAGASATPDPSAPVTPPNGVVAELYKRNNTPKSPFFQTKDRGLVDKYFTKTLGDLIWKDATKANGEVGALDGDPLYNAQDTDIKNIKIGEPDIKKDKATVIVTFENFGKKQTIKFLLAMENGAWKVDNIDYGGGNTIRSWLSADDSGNASESTEFEGKYQVGDTTCTVKRVKMAFEVRWAKGKGVEMFFANDGDSNHSFSSETKDGGIENTFAFDDDNYNTGKFLRADGKELPIKRVK